MLDRAKFAVKAKTDLALAEFLGVNASTIAGYKQRETVPLEQCIKIAERTGVSLDWLILGKGEVGGQAAAKSTVQGAFEILETLRSDQAAVQFVPLYDVPVSAGYGSFFEAENVVQQIPFDAVWLQREGLYAKDLVCLPIAGDSMMPSLKPVDIVLVNRAQTQGDGVFVLRLGNALRIKRLQRLADGRLRISSDNPIYETEYVAPEDLADDFAVIGFCHTKIGRVD